MNVADGTVGALVPSAFVAVSTHVYVLPIVKPVTLSGERVFVPERVAPPSLDVQVAVYFVIAAPFVFGTVNTIVAVPLTALTLAIVGVSGAAAATNALAGDEVLSPMALVAFTVQLYVAEFVSDETTSGKTLPDAVPVVPPLFEVQVAV